MLNVARTRRWAVASCLAGLTIAVAPIALANDEQNSSKQQKQDQQHAQNQQQTQASQQNASQPSDQTSSQNKANQQTQQNQNQQNAGSNQNQTTSDQNQQSSQRNQQNAATNQSQNKSDQSQQASQQGSQQRSQQMQRNSSGKQGASLGVNISGDDQENGVLVVRILPNTPAQRMGLRLRDRIISLNGERVRSADEFISAIRNMNPGDRVDLKVVRNGNEQTIHGELAGYSEAIVQTQGPNGSQQYRGFQSYIEPNQSNSGEASSDQNRSFRENQQTSYEDRGERAGSGDLDARISRIEQQLDRLTQQVEGLLTGGNRSQQESAQKPQSQEINTR
jgi:hypothetical protein